MPPSITEFVDINISLSDAAAERFSFGSALGAFTHNITDDRQNGPFSSIQEVIDAGFTSVLAPNVYNWANSTLSQENGINQIVVGRRVPSTGDPVNIALQVDASGPTYVDETAAANDATAADVDPFPASPAAGDFFAIGYNDTFGKLTFDNAGGTAGVGGAVAWEYWNGTAWTALSSVVDGTSGFTTATADGQVVTFDVPIDWARTTINSSDSLYFVRARVTTTFSTDPVYDQVFIAGDVDLTDSLNQIEADDAGFYFLNTESRAEADLLLAAAWAESRTGDSGLPKYGIYQSSDAAFLNGVAGNVAEDLNAAGYNQSAVIYHANDSEYLDGAWTGKGGGFNLDAPAGGNGGQGYWGNQPLAGVPFDRVTGAQATAIWANKGNIYGRNKGLSFTSKGTSASGRFIDAQVSIHWLKVRLQEAVLGLFVRTPTKIPFTNAGIGTMVATVRGVLNRGVSYGHLSPDFPITINAPDISEVSIDDKIARQLTLTGSVTLAGAIIKLVFNLNVTP